MARLLIRFGALATWTRSKSAKSPSMPIAPFIETAHGSSFHARAPSRLFPTRVASCHLDGVSRVPWSRVAGR